MKQLTSSSSHQCLSLVRDPVISQVSANTSQVRAPVTSAPVTSAFMTTWPATPLPPLSPHHVTHTHTQHARCAPMPGKDSKASKESGTSPPCCSTSTCDAHAPVKVTQQERDKGAENGNWEGKAWKGNRWGDCAARLR
eukprot:1068905-Pelagomonas_calceolata.AAC.3